jgi:hypothetical protein
MSAKENQAAAKQTFGFLHSLTNEYPAKQDGEHEVRIRELKLQRNEHASAEGRWRVRSTSM